MHGHYEDYMGNGDPEPPPGYYDNAVVTEEGLTLAVNLSSIDAEQYALDRRQAGKQCWAVDMDTAAYLQAEWTRLGEESRAALRLARLQVVTETLKVQAV